MNDKTAPIMFAIILLVIVLSTTFTVLHVDDKLSKIVKQQDYYVSLNGDPPITINAVLVFSLQDATKVAVSDDFKNPIRTDKATLIVSSLGMKGASIGCHITILPTEHQYDEINEYFPHANFALNNSAQKFPLEGKELENDYLTGVYACVKYPTSGKFTAYYQPEIDPKDIVK